MQPERFRYDHDAPELDIADPNDDLPPVYDDAAEASTSLTAPLLSDPLLATDPARQSGHPTLQPFRHEKHISYFLHGSLDNDPELLEKHVRAWAATPPRPFVRLFGSHRDTANRNGKRESTKVTDFDVQVELTPYFCPDGGVSRAHCELRTAENRERTRRGTVLRTRATDAGKASAGRVELGMMAEKPSLAQWCHMYCASHAGLKVFQVKRCLGGFDEARVRGHLDALVRRSNYRGTLEITFPIQDEHVEVWSDCRTNQWRLTQWIYVLFCVSMLWVLTWPYLFLRTRRFEVVSAVWNYATVDAEGRTRYTTISEDQWYNLWGRAISKAVLTKRQCTLDQQDLLAAEGRPPPLGTGNTIGDGPSGLVLAGVNAMNEVNRQLGWGEHQD